MVRLTKLQDQGWTFVFEAPVGERLMKRFDSVTTYTPDAQLWWSYERGFWLRHGEHEGRTISSHSRRVRSFKAFLRHIERNPILTEADEVVLESRFVGCSVFAYPPGKTPAGRQALEAHHEQ